MGFISSIYRKTEQLTTLRPPLRELDLSRKKLEQKLKLATEKAKLLALVRANGFPECRTDCRIANLRKYVKEHNLKP